MKTAINIMVDLETMSSAPNAAIVAIGATTFGNGEGARSFFQRAVHLNSSHGEGLHIDPNTVVWWLRQPQPIINATFNTGEAVGLREALESFSEWVHAVGREQEVLLWGNGAAFDNVVLRSAYTALGLPAPWSFRGDRCYRTIKATAPHIIAPVNDRPHEALSDAITQARHLEAIWQARGASPPPEPAPLLFGSRGNCGGYDGGMMTHEEPLLNPADAKTGDMR